MSRTHWLGRPSGRHAAGGRGRTKAVGGSEPAPTAAAPTEPGRPAAPPWAAAAGPLGAPTMADAPPAPLVSPVTDDARAAVAESAASLPAYVPAGLAPLVTIDALGR